MARFIEKSLETKSTSLKMSYEAYLQWVDEDTHAEWVDGEVIIYMPPKNIHQVTLGFLYELLALFVRLFNLGEVRIAPFEVKLSPTGSAREPDIFFITTQHKARLTEERLAGPPDLIIEIVSGDSLRRDRQDKFKEYQTARVPEYWIIDPRSGKQRADFFRLNEAGEYELYATEEDERATSQVLPGFWLRPAWLWQADERDPFRIFCEMAGLPDTFVEQIRRQMRAGFTGVDNEAE
jgi:Uma2 family endonuclease